MHVLFCVLATTRKCITAYTTICSFYVMSIYWRGYTYVPERLYLTLKTKIHNIYLDCIFVAEADRIILLLFGWIWIVLYILHRNWDRDHFLYHYFLDNKMIISVVIACLFGLLLDLISPMVLSFERRLFAKALVAEVFVSPMYCSLGLHELM